MKKILILMLVFIPLLTACNKNSTIEMANASKFDVSFEKMDNEKNEAIFVVSGLPNEEEFAQIPEIIKNSMNSLAPKADAVYNVKVYSALQTTREEAPLFGEVKFTNGAITDPEKIINITTEQYIQLSTK